MSFLNKRLQFIKPRKNGRWPGNFPTDGTGVPLRITRLFPMKLKNVTVESLEKSKRETDVVCLTEMQALFECFEKSEFNRTPCEQHVKALEHCYTQYMKRKDEVKARRKKANNN